MENQAEKSGVLSPTTEAEESIQAAISANFLAEYEPCITCKDLGRNCKGPKLAALGTINNVREYHRRLRSAHKITMKQIFQLTEQEISNATVKDYFSHEEKDFRWATVSLIDNALTVICGDCVGLPPVYLPNCPATSSEIREQIDNVKDQLRLSEESCATLKAVIDETESQHIEQMTAYRHDYQDRVDWLKSDIKLWRKIAFISLGILAIVLFILVFYLFMDIANSNFGIFRD
jgi:DNA-binding transcriptional MerR regulator